MTLIPDRRGDTSGHRRDDAPGHDAQQVEHGFSLVGRVVSMAAGGGGIGALLGPEGLAVGAVVGAVAGVLTAALNGREHRTVEF